MSVFLGRLMKSLARKRRTWLMARTSIFTSFSNADSRIKLLFTQLWFTVDNFVLACCFKLTGKFHFCLNFFLDCCGCPIMATI